MKDFLCVAIGGGLGAISRYAVSLLVQAQLLTGFPLATFTVNISGCFLAGLLAGFGQNQEFLNWQLKLLLVTGFLGSFTTFSAFGLESLLLLRKQEYGMLFLYVAGSLTFSFAGVLMGFKLAAMKG